MGYDSLMPFPSFQALLDDVAALDPQLDYLDGVMTTLDDTDGGLPRDRAQDLMQAQQRRAALQRNIEELLNDMETGTEIVDQYKVGSD